MKMWWHRKFAWLPTRLYALRVDGYFYPSGWTWMRSVLQHSGTGLCKKYRKLPERPQLVK